LSKIFKGSNLFIASLVISGLALVVFMLAPSGVYTVDSKKPTQLYFADNISFAHRVVIDLFNEKYRNYIQVVPIDLPFDKFSTNERKELLTRAFRSQHNRIDIFCVDLIWVPRFAKWSEPLEGYFSPAQREQILSYALQSCYDRGSLVAFPLYIDIGLMYYRKDLLQVLPNFVELEEKLRRSLTWEEFIDLKSKLASSASPFYIFPANNYEGLMCSFFEAIASQESVEARGDPMQLDTPGARRALQLLVDLVNKHRLSPPVITEFKEIEAYRYALQNDALFFRGWPGNLIHFKDPNSDKIRNIGIAALPHFKGMRPAAVFGGWNMMVNKFSKKKEQAIKFVQFAADREIQERIFVEMGYLPANEQVYQDSVFLKSHPELVYYRELLDSGFHRPATADYTWSSDIVSYYIQRAIKQEISVSEALAQASKQINAKEVLLQSP